MAGPVNSIGSIVTVGSEHYYVCRFPLPDGDDDEYGQITIPSSQLFRPNALDLRNLAEWWVGPGVEEAMGGAAPTRPMTDEEREEMEKELDEPASPPLSKCCNYGRGWETADETATDARSVQPADDPLRTRDLVRDSEYIPRYPKGHEREGEAFSIAGDSLRILPEIDTTVPPSIDPRESESETDDDRRRVARDLLSQREQGERVRNALRDNPLADDSSRSSAEAALRRLAPPSPRRPPNLPAGTPRISMARLGELGIVGPAVAMIQTLLHHQRDRFLQLDTLLQSSPWVQVVIPLRGPALTALEAGFENGQDVTGMTVTNLGGDLAVGHWQRANLEAYALENENHLNNWVQWLNTRHGGQLIFGDIGDLSPEGPPSDTLYHVFGANETGGASPQECGKGYSE